MNKQPTLNEEAGLGSEWQAIDTQPIIPGRPSGAPPSPNAMGPYYSGSISPDLQHDATLVGTKYGTPNIPSLPLMPLGSSAAPSVNSGVQSVTNNQINEFITGPSNSIGLTMPSIFSVFGSPTSSGTISVSLISQLANLIFVSPNGSAGLPTFRALVYGDLPNSGVTATSYTNANITVNAQGIVTAASNGSSTGVLPVTVLKSGTVAGNYSTGSTGPVDVDSVNLTYTVTIPIGYVLSITSSGSIQISTGGFTGYVLLHDTVGGVLQSNIIQSSDALASGAVLGNAFGINFSLVTRIIGDGASHTIRLQYNVDPASSGASLVVFNTITGSGAQVLAPNMLFELYQSN